MGLIEDFFGQLPPPEELLAHQKLKEAGSVMARPQLPAWRENLNRSSPLAATALDMIDNMLGIADPMSNIGGPQQTAQILPATWKAMAPEAKAMMNVFADKFPGMFGKVLASKPNLTAEVTSNIPAQAAAVLRKSSPEQHLMKVRPAYAKSPFTAGHEMQHSLNAPRVAATDPLDALTIGTLLQDLLPKGRRGSLNTVLGEATMPDPTAGWLARMIGNAPSVVNPATANRNLMRAAMDEGLAYTAENAARPGADPLLKTLAERLGVAW